jgi:hypothetical protein
MKTQILGLRVGSVVFGLAGLVQLVRVVMQPQVVVAGYVVPLWPSVVAAVVLGGLCVWLGRLSAENK